MLNSEEREARKGATCLRRRVVVLAVGFLGVLTSAPSLALTISVTVPPGDILLGESVEIQVEIAGLGDLGAPFRASRGRNLQPGRGLVRLPLRQEQVGRLSRR